MQIVSYQQTMGRKAIQTTDGRIIAVSSNTHTGIGYTPDNFTIIADTLGNVLSTVLVGGYGVAETTDKGCLIGRSKNISKLDSSGNVLWTRSYSSATYQFEINVIKAVPDSTYICSAFSSEPNKKIVVFKIDNAGDTLWLRKFGNSVYTHESAPDLIILPNEIIILCNHENSSNGYISSMLKLDFNGNILNDIYINTPVSWTGSFTNTVDNHFVITGLNELHKVDTSGSVIWTRSFPNYRIYSVKETIEHEFIIAGKKTITTSVEEPFLLKTDTAGILKWSKLFPSPYEGGSAFNYFENVSLTSDGGYLLCGSKAIFNKSKLFVVKTDSSGNVFSNRISGYVYNDLNNDCIKDASEPVFKKAMVKLDPGPYYTMTNNSGYYSFDVGLGNYTVSQISPNFLWAQNCTQPYSISFSSYNQTQNDINFSNTVSIHCALLKVNISTLNLVRCFKGYHHLNYSNSGTDTAMNVFITVDFGDNIIPISSSIPWSSSINNVYTFNIGSLLPGESGSISILDSVSCNTVVGQTECVIAHIYPDTNCAPVNPVWDHSSIQVYGNCINDSLVCFVIKNTGNPVTGDMTGHSNIRVYSFDLLFETSNFQLAGGDSLIKCYTSDGTPIRLEADQRPGHPGYSHPQAIIEDCGNSGYPSFGFVTTVPEDDEDSFIEIDCQEIVGSFNQNDKNVKPEGITHYHFIKSNDELEYKIDFQNTGSFTISNIYVLDTLSAFLDASTINSMSCSHWYQYRIYGNNILEWKFNNINLPAYYSDPAGSHGYIKFKVKQIDNNPVNTIITNRASIFFDFSSDILTNCATSIVNDRIFFTSAHYANNYSEYDFNIYPNPFSNNTNIKINPILLCMGISIHIIDIYGKLLFVKPVFEEITIIDPDNLSNGIYFLEVVTRSAEKLFVGKIIFYDGK
jgi:uncharacterized repeat protein (TIGR01451 family)